MKRITLKHRAMCFVAGLVCLSSVCEGTQWITNQTFQSSSLGRRMPYNILLPDNYTTGTPYAVLYMLHGRDDSYASWKQYSNLKAAMAGKRFIVVMPEGENSWYEGAWMSYIVRDLTIHIEKTWPVRKSRGICGFSMGGYGSFNIAGQSEARYARSYISVSSMSGAFVDPSYANFLDNVTIRRPSQVADSLAPKASPIMFDCGNEDEYEFLGFDYSLADQNDDMRDMLLARGRTLWTNLWYYRPTGAHDWLYWNSRIPSHLAFHEKAFWSYPDISVTSYNEYVTTVITSAVTRIAGLAYCDDGISRITWKNKASGPALKGVCTGTTNWTTTVTNKVGKNKYTFTAYSATGTNNSTQMTLFLRSYAFRMRKVLAKSNKVFAKTSDITYGDVNSLTNGTGGDGFFRLDGLTIPITNLYWKRSGKYNAKYRLKTDDWLMQIKVNGKAQKDIALYKFKMLSTNVWPTNIFNVVRTQTTIPLQIELGTFGADTNLFLDEKAKFKYKGPWFF